LLSGVARLLLEIVERAADLRRHVSISRGWGIIDVPQLATKPPERRIHVRGANHAGGGADQSTADEPPQKRIAAMPIAGLESWLGRAVVSCSGHAISWRLHALSRAID
jgi:hypothetical protein